MTIDEAVQLIADIRSVFPPYGQGCSLAADSPKENDVHRHYKGTHEPKRTTGHRFTRAALIDLDLPEPTASYTQQARGWEREAERLERRRARRYPRIR